jgi:hypothetical protein
LTGFVAGAAALLLAPPDFLGDLSLNWSSWDAVQESADSVRQNVAQFLRGERGDGLTRGVAWVLAVGGGAVLLALLVEAVVDLWRVAGRRSVFGLNAAVQVALAAVLLVGANYFAFHHYERFDWTRDRHFTLGDDVQRDLRNLRGETMVVVYLPYHASEQLTDQSGAEERRYDVAAERKVVEKVKDLVQQLRELGGRFRVTVLDVEEEGYEEKLHALAREAPELVKAVNTTPENTIFFYAKDDQGRGRMQRMSFNELYYLDKTASMKDTADREKALLALAGRTAAALGSPSGEGPLLAASTLIPENRGNLVLRYQGVRPFVDKVLALDERRPRVGIAVIHEVLTTRGPDEYGLAGLKKALTAHGFEVQDILLKRWPRFGPPEAAAFTFEESKLDDLEQRLALYKIGLERTERDIKKVQELQEKFRTKSLPELTKEFARELRVPQITEPIRRRVLESLAEDLDDLQGDRAALLRQRDEAEQEKKPLLKDERLSEQRRINDLQIKMGRLLADCDVLIIPRMTLRNVNSDFENISYRVYRLEEPQVEAVKEFLKLGKPVLACFGPANEPAERFPPAAAEKDGLEELLAQLGIKFGKQTVLFESESESFAEQRAGLLARTPELPPVSFQWKPGAGLPTSWAQKPEEKPPHPLRQSMSLIAGSLGPGRSIDLRLRHPRPVYYDPPAGKALPYEPIFLMTDARSWNDSDPFPSEKRIPHYEGRKDDPNRGTLDEHRRGPFPIGVAVETMLPAEWYSASDRKPEEVRVAAIGHGGFFTGDDLSPAKEKLLLGTLNWLLGRDDRLPQAGAEWKYPRLLLGEREQTLWLRGACLLLPGLFAFLGLVVLLKRGLR